MAVKFPGGKGALRRLLLHDRAALLHELLWQPMLSKVGDNEGDITPEHIFGEHNAVLSSLLAERDYALLRDLVRQAGDNALRTLLAANPDTLRAFLGEDSHARFIEIATADGGAPLKACLNAASNDEAPYATRVEGDGAAVRAILKSLLLESDYALFRELARSRDYAPLKAVLFEDDYRVLRDLLARQGHAALKTVVLEHEPGWFSMLVRAREGHPLAELLFEDDAALLRHVCRLRGNDALVPMLEENGRRYVGAMPKPERQDLVGQLVVEGGNTALAHLLDAPEFQDRLCASGRTEGVIALARKWEALAGVVNQADPEIQTRYRQSLQAIQSPEHIRGRVLDAITEGDIVRLAHGTLQFPCRHSLWTLIHEILLNEDYYFESDSDAPRIIDGGAHMGMAIYYFKTLYPNARITAFEPEPALCQMAEHNAVRNNYTDVEVLPCALAAERGTARFYTSPQWSMAGALSNHRAQRGEAVEEIEVECVPLSDYLDETVDFLKLDIEGAEDAVLEEAAPKLGNVRNLFCEVHQGAGLPSGRLGKLLGLLEEAGFDVQVAKSHNYQETSRYRPLTHFRGSASQILWARRY